MIEPRHPPPIRPTPPRWAPVTPPPPIDVEVVVIVVEVAVARVVEDASLDQSHRLDDHTRLIDNGRSGIGQRETSVCRSPLIERVIPKSGDKDVTILTPHILRWHVDPVLVELLPFS